MKAVTLENKKETVDFALNMNQEVSVVSIDDNNYNSSFCGTNCMDKYCLQQTCVAVFARILHNIRKYSRVTVDICYAD